ncbi:MAG: hypothetical protein NTZ61_11765 [Proteobacteria bacterium]|nr:hypothetical protein [Pseudomonadota bacterium]
MPQLKPIDRISRAQRQQPRGPPTDEVAPEMLGDSKLGAVWAEPPPPPRRRFRGERLAAGLLQDLARAHVERLDLAVGSLHVLLPLAEHGDQPVAQRQDVLRDEHRRGIGRSLQRCGDQLRDRRLAVGLFALARPDDAGVVRVESRSGGDVAGGHGAGKGFGMRLRVGGRVGEGRCGGEHEAGEQDLGSHGAPIMQDRCRPRGYGTLFIRGHRLMRRWNSTDALLVGAAVIFRRARRTPQSRVQRGT